MYVYIYVYIYIFKIHNIFKIHVLLNVNFYFFFTYPSFDPSIHVSTNQSIYLYNIYNVLTGVCHSQGHQRPLWWKWAGKFCPLAPPQTQTNPPLLSRAGACVSTYIQQHHTSICANWLTWRTHTHTHIFHPTHTHPRSLQHALFLALSRWRARSLARSLSPSLYHTYTHSLTHSISHTRLYRCKRICVSCALLKITAYL